LRLASHKRSLPTAWGSPWPDRRRFNATAQNACGQVNANGERRGERLRQHGDEIWFPLSPDEEPTARQHVYDLIRSAVR